MQRARRFSLTILVLTQATAAGNAARAAAGDGLAAGVVATISPSIKCQGDCDDSGAVSVNELITGVNIALNQASVESCPAFDADGSNSVTVNELVSGVANALNGCPPPAGSVTPTAVASRPTATASRTPLPSAPSPSRTPTRPEPTATPSPSVRPSTTTPARTPTPSTPPAPSATTERHTYCSQSGTLPIPDNDLGGVTDELTIGAGGRIEDLDVRLEIAHTWVGDLAVDLEHVDTGSYTILVDRPLDPSTERSCSADDISCVLDDEAGAAVDFTCADTPPAISGRVSPTDPLTLFDDEEVTGTWALVIVDDGPLDAGELRQWCLEVRQRR